VASLNAYQIKFWRFRGNRTPHPFIDLDMKYVDAEKLLEKLEKLSNGRERPEFELIEERAYIRGIEEVKELIDSFQQEQKDVKLEDALNSLDDAYFDLVLLLKELHII